MPRTRSVVRCLLFVIAGGLLTLAAGCGGAGGPRSPPTWGHDGGAAVTVVVAWPEAESGAVGARSMPAETDLLRVKVTGRGILKPLVQERTKNQVRAGRVRVLLCSVPWGYPRQVLVQAIDLDARPAQVVASRTLTVSVPRSAPLEVHMDMALEPVLSVSPTYVSFHLSGLDPPEEPPAASVSVGNAGGGTLNWSISADQPWISVSPLSGTNDGTLEVQLDWDELPLWNPPDDPGTIDGSWVTVDAGGLTAQIYVSVVGSWGWEGWGAGPVGPVLPPQDLGHLTVIVMWPEAQSGAVGPRGMPAETDLVRVTVTGSGIEEPRVGECTKSDVADGQARIAFANVRSGDGRQVLAEAIDTDMDPHQVLASRTATVTVPELGFAVEVHMDMALEPVLAVSPPFISYWAGGYQSPGRFNILVSNAGEGTLTWNISVDQPWISVSPLSGTNDGIVESVVNWGELPPWNPGDPPRDDVGWVTVGAGGLTARIGVWVMWREREGCSRGRETSDWSASAIRVTPGSAGRPGAAGAGSQSAALSMLSVKLPEIQPRGGF